MCPALHAKASGELGLQARVFGKYVFEFCPGDPAGFTPDEALLARMAADVAALG